MCPVQTVTHVSGRSHSSLSFPTLPLPALRSGCSAGQHPRPMSGHS